MENITFYSIKTTNNKNVYIGSVLWDNLEDPEEKI